MRKSDQYYVTPRIEVYELENEGFIAGSSPDTSRNPVSFGGGDGGGGWTLSKDGSVDARDEEELRYR